MKTKLKLALLAVLYLSSAPFLHAQTVQANATLQDNRFITVAIAATNPSSSSRNYVASDVQLNSIIHYNARIATAGGYYTGSNRGTQPAPVQNPTPFPSATPTPTPTATPTPTPTPPSATPTPTPTATPYPSATPKKAKRPKKARDHVWQGNW